MNKNTMKQKTLIISFVATVLVLVAGFLWIRQSERAEFDREKEELAELQRQAMQEELDNLSNEYEQQYNKLTINGREMQVSVSNDSLMVQLMRERDKVDRLMEELNSVKSSNAARIAQLSREVGTLRKILRSYVVQIDSLHTINERLKAENKQVQADYEQASNQVRQLSNEKSALTQQVNLAAKLDATAIGVQALDKRGKSTKKISKVENIQLSFVVPKNITAQVGNKTFYARIMTPVDEVLVKAGSGGTFAFEGKQIPYSMRREVEYNGEEMSVTMYWAVEESLSPGTYRVMIFEGGSLIGQSSFSL